MKENSKIIIKSKKYGNVSVFPDKSSSFGECYFVTAKKNRKELCGLITLDGKEIIRLQEMELVEEFHTSLYKDICLGFKHHNCNYLEYYHLKKQDNNIYKLVLKTNPYDSVPIEIRQIKDNNDYWLFETQNKEKEIALYSIEKCKNITNFFSEIQILDKDESPNHKIYYNKNIYIYLPNENNSFNKIYVTSLCGFMDEYGNFSSQIYDVNAGKDKDGLLYSTFHFGGNSLSKTYYEKIKLIQEMYLKQYQEKEEIIDQVLSFLFTNPDLSDKPVKYNNTKILDFNSRKKV